MCEWMPMPRVHRLRTSLTKHSVRSTDFPYCLSHPLQSQHFEGGIKAHFTYCYIPHQRLMHSRYMFVERKEGNHQASLSSFRWWLVTPEGSSAFSSKLMVHTAGWGNGRRLFSLDKETITQNHLLPGAVGPLEDICCYSFLLLPPSLPSEMARLFPTPLSFPWPMQNLHSRDI